MLVLLSAKSPTINFKTGHAIVIWNLKPWYRWNWMDLFQRMPVVSDNPLSLSGSKVHVLVAHNNSSCDSQRTLPSGPTQETDLPDTTTMRRLRGNFEDTVPLKSLFFTNSGSIISEDGIRENCTHVARRSDGTTRTAGIGTSCERGAHACRKEEYLCTNSRRKVTKSEMNDNANVCAGLSQKKKDRAERSVQGAQHSSVGARDETKADKESQRGTSRTRTTSTGNPGLRTTPREELRMGVCPRQTVLRVSDAESRGGWCYSVATAK